MKILYNIFLYLSVGSFLMAGYYNLKGIRLNWKGYSLHPDKLTEEEKAAREEIRTIKWWPLYFVIAASVFFFLAVIFNNL